MRRFRPTTIVTFGQPVAAGDDSAGEVDSELRDLFAGWNHALDEIPTLPIIIQIASRAQNLGTKWENKRRDGTINRVVQGRPAIISQCPLSNLGPLILSEGCLR